MHIPKTKAKKLIEKYVIPLLKLQNIYDYDVEVEKADLFTLWDFFKQQKSEAILFTNAFYRDMYMYIKSVMKEIKAMPNCDIITLDAYKFRGFLWLVQNHSLNR